MQKDRKEIKLIAFDLDGTFLDDRKNIPEENLRAIEFAASQGIHIVPATGRLYNGLPAILQELDFIRYYILINGAQVYDAQAGKVLVSADISNGLAISLMDHAEEIGAYYDCYKDNRGVMNQAMYDYLDPVMPDANYRAYMRSVRTPVADLRTYLRTDGGNVQKVQYFFSDLSERAHQLEVLNGLFPGIKATSSLSTNIEINSVNAGKGPALEKLCACLGFSAENAMAFGDGTNDLDMLIAAGVGVAMSNSDTKLFPHADLITPCDNNSAGVGKAIFDYLRG